MTRPTRRRFLFAGLTLLLCVALFEVLLQVLCLVSSRVDGVLFPKGHTVDDDRLGRRPNPGYYGHDEKGFRNASVPARADMVALGDSQTYGTGVSRDEAWPQLIERLGGRTSYNMSFSGFSPVHSVVLLDEAFALRPRVVVEAFYSGNDLFDAFDLVYVFDRFPSMKSRDPSVLAQMEKLERDGPLREKSNRVLLNAFDDDADLSEAVEELAGQSAVLGLWRAAARRVRAAARKEEPAPSWETVKSDAERSPDLFEVLERGPVRKVLTPDYRLTVLDLSDPRIEEGMRICLEAIDRMDEKLRAGGVEFAVLIIPTAEMVHEEVASQAGAELSASYRKLLENEKVFMERTRRHLEGRKIKYIEGLPALRGLLRAGVLPYPMGPDGHPNAVGQHAIATAVLEGLGMKPAPGK